MIEEYVAKDHVILVKNPDYDWAPEFMMHQGPAYLDKITFRFYPDAATRIPALESGEAQIMGEIPPIEANRLMSDARFSIYPVNIPGQSLQMFVNTAKSPTDDLLVRQALIYGCDREAIVNGIFRGFSPVAHGPMGRTTPFYYDGVEGMYPLDMDKAKSLLEEAGWIDTDDDGIRDKDGEKLVLNTILMGWGSMPEVGTAMQGLYRQLGVEIEAQILSYPAALEAARITGAFAPPDSAGRSAALRDSLDTSARLQREIASLRSQAQKEKQLNRRVELNLQVKRLEAELAAA